MGTAILQTEERFFSNLLAEDSKGKKKPPIDQASGQKAYSQASEEVASFRTKRKPNPKPTGREESESLNCILSRGGIKSLCTFPA